MKKYIVIISCLLSAVNMQGQKAWGLRECIDFAVKNNVEIKQQELLVKGAEIDVNTSKNSRLPNLNAQIDHSFKFANSIVLPGSAVKNLSQTTWGATTSTPIFTGFKISNDIKSKEFSLLASTEGLKKAKENLELQITSYYLDILFKKEILKVYEEQVALTEKQKTRTNLLVESGKVAKSQIFDMNAQLAKDQLNVTVADNDLINSILVLTQALNLQSAKGFDIENPNLSDETFSRNFLSGLVSTDEVYQTAIRIKPHVKEVVYQIESSRKNLKVAESGYWPKLSLDLGYTNNATRYYGADNVSFGDQFKNNRNEYISLTLTVPIFNRFEVRNQVRKARLDIINEEYNLTNVKLNLYKEIQQAHQNSVAAEAKYISTERAYDAALESFKYAEERYQIGKLTVFEYSEAQTKLISSRSEQIQAKYDFVFRSKILDFYQGKRIEI